ncbi:MAG: mobile mystery protein B, partial [Rickettsiaceae bacterium]|nr:mobile mystery protein B [Rickettsiaceae bacterium]
MRFIYAEGATPLSADEIHNLIPKHLTTQKELNEWEQFNIVKGENWAFSTKRRNILSI